MKKTKKVILSISTIFMSLCLMVFGVFAALQQNVTVNGRIEVNVNSSANARMAVVASSKVTNVVDFVEYGSKTSYVNEATFTAPDEIFNEDVYFMVHKFEFTNYGSEIVSFDLEVQSLDDSLENNFNCFIGENEKTISNQSNTYTAASPFLAAFEEGNDAPTKTVYVYIELRDELTANQFECNYNITIQYEATGV